MSRKLKQLERVWIVLANDEYQACGRTFKEAEEKAKDLVEEGKDDVKIFEVVGGWQVIFPEDPDPVTYDFPLDDL